MIHFLLLKFKRFCIYIGPYDYAFDLPENYIEKEYSNEATYLFDS